MNYLVHTDPYDHSDRGLLILAIFTGITLIVFLVKKYLR
jgi:hypothetical protein